MSETIQGKTSYTTNGSPTGHTIRGYHESRFTNCAVDRAGPYLTVQGRGKVRVKRYLCLFLCLQTHSGHVEMAFSEDTDGFLNALTRMVARRGWPRDMLSDNGTNFIGGCKEINQSVKQMDPGKVQKMTSNKRIN